MASTPSPLPVRIAGALVVAQGAVGVGVAVLLVVQAFRGPGLLGAVLGEAVFFGLLGAAVAAAGVGLIRSRRWARAPSLLVQLLLLGATWYAIGPSGRPEYGVPVAVLCLVIGGLLLSPRARSWAVAEWRRPGRPAPGGDR